MEAVWATHPGSHDRHSFRLLGAYGQTSFECVMTGEDADDSTPVRAQRLFLVGIHANAHGLWWVQVTVVFYRMVGNTHSLHQIVTNSYSTLAMRMNWNFDKHYETYTHPGGTDSLLCFRVAGLERFVLDGSDKH